MTNSQTPIFTRILSQAHGPICRYKKILSYITLESEDQLVRLRIKKYIIGPISGMAWAISIFLHLILIVAALNWGLRQNSPGTEQSVQSFEITQQAQADTLYDGSMEIDTQIDSLITTQNFQGEIFDQRMQVMDQIMPSEPVAVDEKIFDMETGIAAGSANAQAQNAFAKLSASGKQARGDFGVSFFGISAKGSKFIYLVDRSGSMSNGPLGAAKDELIRSIRSLRPEMKFNVFFYNESSVSFSKKLLAADPANKKNLESWCKEIQSDGGTDPTEAIKKAFALEPDCIWILSDGAFDESILDLIASINKNKDIKINTIAFMNEAGCELLERIAKDNNGKYRFIPMPNSMKNREQTRRSRR